MTCFCCGRRERWTTEWSLADRSDSLLLDDRTDLVTGSMDHPDDTALKITICDACLQRRLRRAVVILVKVKGGYTPPVHRHVPGLPLLKDNIHIRRLKLRRIAANERRRKKKP